MSKASIALNRFGYGLRQGESVPDDAERHLLRQIDRFDPRPDPLKDRVDTSAQAGKVVQLIRDIRRKRQDQAGQMSPGGSMEDMARAANVEVPPELRQAVFAGNRIMREDVERRLKTATISDTPMVERLVHFWANHFSVSAGKAGSQYQVGNHEFFAVRPNVLGKFRDLLEAAVLHPAMLLYLDQFQSIGPNAPFVRRRNQRAGNSNRRGLNENLAREILELHTLGVDGGYTQADVTEFARALTGWTIDNNRRFRGKAVGQPQDSGAVFVAAIHEPGTRTVLGRNYRDSGEKQALAILDDLATHPSTARFVSTKLARHFAGDTPPASLVTRLEQDFLATGGDLASLTRTLVEAPEVWVDQPVKFRQPFEWLVSTCRLIGIETLGNDRRTSHALTQLGQMPWRASSPAGFDDLADSWAGSDALFRRVELANQIALRAQLPDSIVGYAETAFPGTLSASTRLALSRAESSQQALGLLLVSPEMMRR